MRIDIEKIPEQGLEIQGQEPASIIAVKEKDIEFNVPVNVSIVVNCISDTLLVKGKLKTKANLVCSRCLKKFEYSAVNKDFRFDLDVRGLNEVDLTDNIREGVIMLLPLKPLCKSDCKGICTKCGQNLNDKECGCDRGHEEIRWKDLDQLSL